MIKPNNNSNNQNQSGNRRKGNINDSSFYYKDVAEAKQYWEIPFNNFAGKPVLFGKSEAFTSQGVEKWMYIDPSSVMAVYVDPCVPKSLAGDPTSGINNISQKNYTMLVASNALSQYFQGSDVTVGTLTTGSLLCLKSFIERAFKLSYMYNPQNRAWPEIVYKCMDIDPEDFRANLGPYRNRYNALLTLASNITYPKNIKYLEKCERMFSNIYMDSKSSIMAQLYIINPSSLWVLDEMTQETGSHLVTVDICREQQTSGATFGREFGYYLDVFENMIRQILNSTTFNYLMANIKRCLIKGTIKSEIRDTFKPILETDQIKPIYNDEVSLWIHNMTIAGRPIEANEAQVAAGYTTKNDVYSDPNIGGIVYNPILFSLVGTATISFGGVKQWVDTNTESSTQVCGKSLLPKGKLFDFFSENPSLEDKISASRLAFTVGSWKFDSTSGWIADEYAQLDFRVRGIYVANVLNQGTEGLVTGWSMNASYFCKVTDGADKFTERLSQMADLSKFDWSPMIFEVGNDKSGGTDYVKIRHLFGDLNYYTYVPFNLLKSNYDLEIMRLLEIHA